MGIICCCFNVRDEPEANSNGSDSPDVHITGKRKETANRSEVQAVPATQAQRSATATSDASSSRRVHPENTPIRYQSLPQGNNGVLILDKTAGPSLKEHVPYRQTEMASCSDQYWVKSEFYNDILSPDDEDVCPTCLEEYDYENPKIVTRCSHHFHLACIYEWMERSQECPVCFRVMEFDETV